MIQAVGLVLAAVGLVLFVKDQWIGRTQGTSEVRWWKFEASGPPGLLLILVGVTVFLVPTLLPVFGGEDGPDTSPTADPTAASGSDPSGSEATTSPDPTPTAASPSGVAVRVNFQSATAPVPDGYLVDFGQPFGPRTGADQGEGLAYGWVDPATREPLDLVAHARDRDREGIEQRLDTLMHMAGFNPGTNEVEPGSWEIALPAGRYHVTVYVGDGAYNSQHTVLAEGVTVVDHFESSESMEYEFNSVEVEVTDGRLTLSSPPETNTKINLVEIARVG